jgi:hypothetical protein
LIGRSVEGGAGKLGDERRTENRNYLVGANRTFDLVGSLAPIGTPSIMPVTAGVLGPDAAVEIIIKLKQSTPMSEMGHNRTLRGQITMSALHLKADISQHCLDVRFGPKADI